MFEDWEKPVTVAMPVPDDNSDILDSIKESEARDTARKAIAEEAIIEIRQDLKKDENKNTKRFAITTIIAGLALLIAVAAFILDILQ